MRRAHSSLVSSLCLSLAALLLTTIACEGLLRLALFTSIFPEVIQGAFRRPELYAQADTDNYWKLRGIWADNNGDLGNLYHPVLGTTTARTPANPLGVFGRSRQLPPQDAAEPVLLFYGDSYLTMPFWDDQIPQILDSMLPETAVWNLGMWSYGIDQIVLRFELTHGQFRDPTVLIGILTDDIDRCVLSVRGAQKPRFVLEHGGELRLTNVPIQRDQAAYLREHPPMIRSYLLRVTVSALRRTRFSRWLPAEDTAGRRIEKEAVAAALIERAVTTCRAEDIPLGFVLFYTRHELQHGGWRPAFLRGTFERLGIPYLDTKLPLDRAQRNGQATLDELFDADTQHHTALANRLIAEAIARKWPTLFRHTHHQPDADS